MDVFPKPPRAPADDRDMLTGLPGVDTACAWLDRAGQDGCAQAMLVGLHRFQSVNLAYGKAAGDRVLLKALEALQGTRYLTLAERRQANEAFLYGWLANRLG